VNYDGLITRSSATIKWAVISCTFYWVSLKSTNLAWMVMCMYAIMKSCFQLVVDTWEQTGINECCTYDSSDTNL